MEVQLKVKGYSDKLERGQMLKARIFSWSEVLNKQKRAGNKNGFVFNIVYHAMFSEPKKYLLLISDRVHGKDSEKVVLTKVRNNLKRPKTT